MESRIFSPGWQPRLASFAGALAALVGAAVFIAWLADVPALTLFGGGPSMKPNTAASVAACGLALFFAARSDRAKRLCWPFAAFVLLLNGLILIEYFSGASLGVDHLFIAARATDAAPAGRTSFASLLALLALAAGTLLAKRRGRLADACALLGGAIGLLGLIMRLYGDQLLVTNATFTIAPHTAGSLLVLALGLLAVNEGGPVSRLMCANDAGGALARRLIPLCIFMPVVLGWLRIASLHAGLLAQPTDLALLAIGLIAAFLAIAWESARKLGRADAARQVAIVASEVARREAVEANRVKDDFLEMLGHELRNPLAPIFTALELMKASGKPGFEREQAIVERQSRRLKRLMDDLLDVSRVARGELALHRESLPLLSPLRDAVETLAALFRQNGHEPRIESAGEPLWASADADRLSQVFENLLANASRHSAPGKPIRIALARDGETAVITVRDEGAGIPPELFPRVFDKFVQQPQSIDRTLGGLGLGLTLVRSIVQLHGGTVTIESSAGAGTTVTLRLPAIEAPPALLPVQAASPAAPLPTPMASPAPSTAPASPAPAAPLAPDAPIAAPSRPASKKILVVDDNLDAAELLSMLLESVGHSTRSAFDGEEALRVSAEFMPDIALLDIGLPLLDGYEVARRLRANPAHRGIHICAITGFGQAEAIRRSKEAGFDHHFVKPIDFDKLSATLQALIAKAETGGAAAALPSALR